MGGVSNVHDDLGYAVVEENEKVKVFAPGSAIIPLPLPPFLYFSTACSTIQRRLLSSPRGFHCRYPWLSSVMALLTPRMVEMQTLRCSIHNPSCPLSWLIYKRQERLITRTREKSSKRPKLPWTMDVV
jgi:hypothetical protein